MDKYDYELIVTVDDDNNDTKIQFIYYFRTIDEIWAQRKVCRAMFHPNPTNFLVKRYFPLNGEKNPVDSYTGPG